MEMFSAALLSPDYLPANVTLHMAAARLLLKHPLFSLQSLIRRAAHPFSLLLLFTFPSFLSPWSLSA